MCRHFSSEYVVIEHVNACVCRCVGIIWGVADVVVKFNDTPHYIINRNRLCLTY